MNGVREWLVSIGLDRYVDAFEENEIGFDVLPHLDHAVLKDIGVKAAGFASRIV